MVDPPDNLRKKKFRKLQDDKVFLSIHTPEQIIIKREREK